MSVETIARRYAAALADVVLKNGDAASVAGELREWESLLASNNDLNEVLGNPAIAHVSKKQILESLIQKAGPTTTTANFLRILLDNGRLTELSEISGRFANELEDRGGIVAAEVTAARDLPESEKAELKASLEKLTGKTVRLKFGINEELIGGVVTRIGSTVYDGSVKTQLENLRQQLIDG